MFQVNWNRFLSNICQHLHLFWTEFGKISLRFWTNMRFSMSSGIKWHKLAQGDRLNSCKKEKCLANSPFMPLIMIPPVRYGLLHIKKVQFYVDRQLWAIFVFNLLFYEVVMLYMVSVWLMRVIGRTYISCPPCIIELVKDYFILGEEILVL